MRRFVIVSVLVFSLGVMLACSFGRSPASPPPATPLPYVPITRELVSVLGETSLPMDVDGPYTVVVLNQSDSDICHVHITGSDSEAWGPDVLGDGEVIGPGMSWASESLSGPHDVLVRNCDDAVLETAWELLEDNTIVIGGTGLIPLRVVNESTAVICYLTIDLSTAQEPPQDRLGLWETLDSQFPERIFFVEPGTYSLGAIDCDDNLVHSEAGVNVYADAVWTISDDGQLNVVPLTGFTVSIENRTSDDICYVYIAPAEQETWGEEWLGDEAIIASGETHNFDVSPGSYDVMVADCEDAIIDTAWEVSSDVVLHPGASGSVAVQIINATRQDLCYIYISPSSAEDWGADWLPEMETVLPDSIRTFFVEPDMYDLTVQNCDGEEIASQYEVLLQERWAWTVTE